MALNNKKRCIWTNVILIPCFMIIVTTASVPPDIIPNEDALTLDRGETLQLICNGDDPLEWTHTNADFLATGRVNITNTEGNTRPYSSMLRIENLTHSDAGYFTCSYKGASPETSDEFVNAMASVVVYVRDEAHLLKKGQPSDIVAIPGQSPDVPCIRSWPDVAIQIFHDSSPLPIPLTDKNYIHSIGFKIENIQERDAGRYTCKAKFKNKEEEQTFTVHVLSIGDPQTTSVVYNPTLRIIKSTSLAAGDNFEVLCFTEQFTNVFFNLVLAGPALLEDADRVIRKNGTAEAYVNKRRQSTGQTKSWYQKAIVKHAKKEDSGNYTCTLTTLPIKTGTNKTVSQRVTVFEDDERYLDVSTASEHITQKEHRSARWIINITSFPLKYDFSWKNPRGNEISNKPSAKYRIDNTSRENEYLLEVIDATLLDAGMYPFTVFIPGTDVESKTLNLSLTVEARPQVGIVSNGPQFNFVANETYEIHCAVKAHPRPTIKWSFQECTTPSNCKRPEKVTEESRNTDGFYVTSTIEFNATRHGRYICIAQNKLGNASDTKNVRVVDFSGDNEMQIVKPSEIVEGDNLKIVCIVSKLGRTQNISFAKIVNGDLKRLEPNGQAGIFITEDETTWSWRKLMDIKSVPRFVSGKYSCATMDSKPLSSNFTINVLNVSVPQFVYTNLNNSKISMKKGDSKNLTCQAKGLPRPEIIWTWDDLEKSEWPSILKYHISSDNTTLFLQYVHEDAEGRFMCIARNRNGSVSAFQDISVTGVRIFSNLAVGIIVILVAAVIVFGVIVIKYKHKQAKMNRFLKEISQKDFYNGAVENINPDLGVADQAYLLPFDVTWEFPKERLKLGIQLGSGAFGRVVKADACGILDSEPITTVAVKMVKPNADESHFKALMSELKIMVHLGKHINVVNLLGACTKNLAKKKELFVIVEYCKYGSLLSYMHRHRRTFINQLDPTRGVIDSTIDIPAYRISSQSQPPRIHYAQLTFVDGGNSRKPASNGYRTLDEFAEPNAEDPPTPILQPIDGHGTFVANGSPPQSSGGLLTPNRRSTEHYVAESQVESVCTGMTYISNGPSVVTDGTTKRRSSCGSQYPDHYRGDYQVRDVTPIKTTDLLCWAFQIARGMEYLASRKVLHGDLATRNVLLAENNIVKICDFGLAKEMYKDYKYKKKSEGVLLPVKWMAIESVYYGLFSTQSDCWSFGVVLWELFTLGKTPYPGMEADERFYKMISEGYRMEKPPMAPSCVYDTMLECWAQEPTDRPSFSTLVDRIGDMMEDGLRNHYVDLNTAYMKINQATMNGRPDYLSQMGGSDFVTNSARPSPERAYQNVPEEVDNSGYLKPILPTSSRGTEQTIAPPHYQNVESPPVEPSCSMLANNTGYMFVKSPISDSLHLEQRGAEQIPNGHVSNEDTQHKVTLQLNYSPDIKDMYGLREDSTSPEPDHYLSMMDSSIPENLDDNQVKITVGSNGIRGVDNKNYVQGPLIFRDYSTQDTTGNKIEECNDVVTPRDLDNSHDMANDRREKRQKNDSGLGSIDSNQFDPSRTQKYTGQEKQSNMCSEYNNFHQQPNGYVSHHNISTFS